MNNIVFSIPFFERMNLNGFEVSYGFLRGYISEDIYKALLKEMLTEDFTYGISDAEAVRLMKVAGSLCRDEVQPLRRKWTYLFLLWLYENRARRVDPLEDVEEVYAEFDYPVYLEAFVRYMPAKDGYDSSKHTYEENIERLFSKWEEYLEQEKQELAGESS